jgi:hypothetical protein
MKASTINELKQELKDLPASKLTELCLRLARFKKENKELLTYLLFESYDEAAYIQSVKREMDDQFASINASNIYFAKKSIRKILRMANKYIRYSGSKTVEIELLIHFCNALNETKIPYQQSAALLNIYHAQTKKIDAAIKTLHEDLQFDYLRQWRGLTG